MAGYASAWRRLSLTLSLPASVYFCACVSTSSQLFLSIILSLFSGFAPHSSFLPSHIHKWPHTNVPVLGVLEKTKFLKKRLSGASRMIASPAQRKMGPGSMDGAATGNRKH